MKRPHYLILLPLLSLLAAACSTTSALPDDEQLYTGIKKITYADDPALRRTRKGRDSVGVITAVGNAVEAVSQALQGKGGSLTDALQPTQPLTKEEIKEAKRQQAADEADFAIAKAEVDAVLAYPPNNALFGSSYYHSPLQVGLWLHNGLADAKGKLGQWIFRHFATDPVLLSQVNPQMRAKVATNTLHNYGYFKGRVNYEVLTAKNPRKAKVRYDVRAGDLYRLDSVAYVGFLPAIDSLLRQHSHEALLHRGDAFSVVNLAAEQTRIAQLLRNYGYYYFNPNYTTFRADTVMRRCHVQLQVVPADNRPPRADRPWYIGRT